MGKKKLVFNLSIDDLKELGIIKPRRRRKSRQIKYIQQPQNNIKSSSDHMVGYTNAFSNTNNLQTENLRLQNDLLTKYPMLQASQNNNINNNFENRFKSIEDENQKHKALTQYILTSAYGGEFNNNNNRHMTKYSGIRDAQVEELPDDPNHIVHEDDGIDVTTTLGSEGFSNYNNDKDGVNTPNTPNTTQIGIRNPNDLNESYDEEIEFVASTPQKDQEEVLLDGEETKVDTRPQTRSQTQLQAELEEKTKIEARKQSQKKHLEKLSVLRKEYSKLGGEDTTILGSKKQGDIKDAIDAIKTRLENENRRILQNLKHQYTELGGNEVDILESTTVETIEEAISDLQKLKNKKKKNKKSNT
jgi:hypothetical protein